MSCVEVTSYSCLLVSCVRMLLSSCAYIITHSALSSEAKRERSSSWREQRNGQSVVTRQEDESFSRRGDWNSRTVTDREVVNHEAEQARTEREREAPETEVKTEAAVIRNGTVDDVTTATTTTSNTKPPINTKVRTTTNSQG